MVDKVVLFDYGGVLGYDHLIDKEELLACTLELTQAELNNRLSEKSAIGKAFRENQVTEVEFWRFVSKNDKIDQVSACKLTNMWMDTYRLNGLMMDFLQQLRKNVKIGVLTNIDVGRSALLEEILDSKNNLDYYFPSYIFGFSKDTSQLWRLVNEKLMEENPELEVIYIDDRAEHVLSAERIGWKGIQYYDFIQLKRQIGLLIDC